MIVKLNGRKQKEKEKEKRRTTHASQNVMFLLENIERATNEREKMRIEKKTEKKAHNKSADGIR